MVTSWTVETTRALVNLHTGQANVQKQLKGVGRNRTTYEREAKELRELEYESACQQCHTKIKNLTQRYRKAIGVLRKAIGVLRQKYVNSVSGTVSTTCLFFTK